jgi:hypothetical protein
VSVSNSVRGESPIQSQEQQDRIDQLEVGDRLRIDGRVLEVQDVLAVPGGRHYVTLQPVDGARGLAMTTPLSELDGVEVWRLLGRLASA